MRLKRQPKSHGFFILKTNLKYAKIMPKLFGNPLYFGRYYHVTKTDN